MTKKTHPRFMDVHIELYGRAIYKKDTVILKFKWVNNAGYDIEKRPKWREVPNKFFKELIEYAGT